MYDHSYSCDTCGRLLVLRSATIVSPMSGKVGIHSSFAGQVDFAYYGITQVVSGVVGATSHCHGILRYKAEDIRVVNVVAAVAPPPPTALTYSSQFAAQQQAPGVNTICAAYDSVRDRAMKGVNAHGISRDNLNAALQAKLNLVDQLEGWGTTNCAEIQAVHRLLEDGSQIANIRVHSRDQFGQPKPPCENCQGWLVAVAGQGFRVR